MSDYGLKIFDGSGSVTLDVDDQITRLRYSNEVAADANGNTTLSDTSGLSSVEISIAVDPSGFNRISHLFVRSGTTFTWTAQSNTGLGYTSTKSLVYSFLYT